MSFIKWCGGKSKQTDKIITNFPNEYDLYCEIFVGGGSVFFKLQPTNAILNDINPNLINTYIMVKTKLRYLKIRLKKMHKDYNTLEFGSEARKTYYYDIRTKFNEIKYKTGEKVEDKDNKFRIKLAAYFIFLNKAGYNGMYRENKSGGFNIPIGKYKVATIYNEAVLNKCSKLLQNTEIYCMNWMEMLEIVKNREEKVKICYLDPPYYVCNESKFKSYTENGFSNQDQENLAKYLLDNRITFFQSNSYCSEVLDLYKFANEIIDFDVNRSIKGSSDRGTSKEVFITYNPIEVVDEIAEVIEEISEEVEEISEEVVEEISEEIAEVVEEIAEVIEEIVEKVVGKEN